MKRRDGKMTYEESLQFLVKDFGDDIIKILPVEKRLEGLDPAQRLEGLTSEQILTALAQKQLLTDRNMAYLMQQLNLEERKVMMEQLLQSLLAAIPEQTTHPATPA